MNLEDTNPLLLFNRISSLIREGGHFLEGHFFYEKEKISLSYDELRTLHYFYEIELLPPHAPQKDFRYFKDPSLFNSGIFGRLVFGLVDGLVLKGLIELVSDGEKNICSLTEKARNGTYSTFLTFLGEDKQSCNQNGSSRN